MSGKRRLLCILFLVVIGALPQAREAAAQYAIAEAFPNLRFQRPADLANDGLGALYVAEQAGRIYTFTNTPSATDTTVFLDIRERIVFEIESGLLGLAFHPNYEENGFFYTYYIADNPLRSVISRWRRSDEDPRSADPSSELVLLEVEQPTRKHNAGDLSFGADGFLYAALGDGSQGDDLFGHGQNLETLLGSILRIDVDNPEDGMNYGIPDDNPFVGNLSGYREEIYAFGFRNPWRFSIDPVTQDIWVGDVGELTWEEISFVTKGGNYGWPIMEGAHCYKPPENCSQEGLYPPVWFYDHASGRAVIGGYVYRGSRLPDLQGKYIFAEWDKRQVWALTYDGDPYANSDAVHVEEILIADRHISTFGTDEHGELYMLFTFEGRIMQFVAADDTGVETPQEPAFSFELAGPNPFSASTSIQLVLDYGGHASVNVYDVVGRHVRTLFDGFLAAGRAETIEFEPGSLSSGLYLCRVESARRSETIKLLLIR